MKILLIASKYSPHIGGLESATRELARGLSNLGHYVGIVTNRYPRTLGACDVFDNVRVCRWHFLVPRFQQILGLRLDLFLAGILHFPLTLGRLIHVLRWQRPDVVNLHFVGAPALFVLLACWFVSFRLVVSMHGHDVDGLSTRSGFDRWVFRRLLRRADVVTACSQYLLDAATKIEPLAKGKGRVIHNGIKRLPELRGITRPGVLVAVGRMVPKKGFDVLLRAQAASKCKTHLMLIGDGPEREALEQLSQTLGLDNIQFAGLQDHTQVLREMSSADMVIVPSREESFGLVALEAMTLGKPVVATRVGGLPEVLEGADAVLVPPDDPTALAEAIGTACERLRSDPRFGSRNRACARRFSMERMTDAYLKAYSA